MPQGPTRRKWGTSSQGAYALQSPKNIGRGWERMAGMIQGFPRHILTALVRCLAKSFLCDGEASPSPAATCPPHACALPSPPSLHAAINVRAGTWLF